MNLWPSKVAQQLRDGTLPKRARFHYLLLVLIAPALEHVLGLVEGFPAPSAAEHVSGLVQTGLCTVGILACYTENERGDGRDFIDRLFCLALPVGIWLIPFWLIGWWLIVFASPEVHDDVLVLEIWASILTLTFCARLHYFIHRIATKREIP